MARGGVEASLNHPRAAGAANRKEAHETRNIRSPDPLADLGDYGGPEPPGERINPARDCLRRDDGNRKLESRALEAVPVPMDEPTAVDTAGAGTYRVVRASSLAGPRRVRQALLGDLMRVGMEPIRIQPRRSLRGVGPACLVFVAGSGTAVSTDRMAASSGMGQQSYSTHRDGADGRGSRMGSMDLLLAWGPESLEAS
jgi:hypothetical protein